MPITFSQATYTPINDITTDATSWLNGNINDYVQIDLPVQVYAAAIGTEDDPIRYTNSGQIGANWIQLTTQGFNEFFIGDSIKIVNSDLGTTDTRTIVDKKDNYTIQVDGAALSETSFKGFISVNNVITGFEVEYNFIENAETPSYISKFNSKQIKSFTREADASEIVTPVTLTEIGFIQGTTAPKILGDGIDDGDVYISSFIITIYTRILNLSLVNELTDFLNGDAPSYFVGNKCLKFIANVRAYEDQTNPNKYIQGEYTNVKGNVGSFNENLNTDINNFSVSDLVFTNEDSEVIEAIEINGQKTTINFNVNSTNSVFSNSNTSLIVGIYKLIESEDEIKNNGLTYIQSICLDEAKRKLGQTATNGDKYGTGYQAITDFACTYVSTSQCSVELTIDFGADQLTQYALSDTPRYCLYIQTGDHTKGSDLTDKEKLIVSKGEFYESFYITDLVKADTVFMRSPESDPENESIDNPDLFPLDIVVAYNQFYIDKSKLDVDDTFEIKSIAQSIVFKKNDDTEFTVDSSEINVQSSLVVNDNQYFNINSQRPFATPNGNEKNTIKLKRRPDLDSGDKKYYEGYFPFIYRMDYWNANSTTDLAFFDVEEQNNGLNHEWFRYDNTTNWSIYNRLTVNVLINGNDVAYTFDTIMTSYNWDSNTDWVSTIKTYNNSNDVYLYDTNNSKKLILGYTDTRVEATFEKQSGTPDMAYIHVDFKIFKNEKADPTGIKWFSSFWETENTWFKSIDTSNKINLELDGDTVIATALIDNNTIPKDSGEQYLIAARIYEVSYDFKLTEDGIYKATEEGFLKIIE